MTQFLDQAVAQGMIGTNPAQNITVPRPKTESPRRILDDDEIAMVLEAVRLDRHKEKLSGVLPVAAYLGLLAGLRQGEMGYLERDRLDAANYQRPAHGLPGFREGVDTQREGLPADRCAR